MGTAANDGFRAHRPAEKPFVKNNLFLEYVRMLSILSLLFVIFISIIITRVATIALTHTGLTRETAKFQARSAFSGAGFTTSESELVVNHPVRRKIVLFLILIGNAGIVAAISSLMLTFVGKDGSWDTTTKIILLAVGFVALWSFATSPWVDRRLSVVIDKVLKRYTDLNVVDYDSLLHLAGEYRLVELAIEANDWLEGKKLSEARLRDEGINVLGVKRTDGTYLGNPDGETQLRANDSVILYGRVASIEALDRRWKSFWGDAEHRDAVAEQKEVEDKEIQMDKQTESRNA
jgi:hypothetical protein